MSRSATSTRSGKGVAARARPRAPKRRLSRSAEDSLTPRQLEILDALEAWVLKGGFADVTMAEIARRMECSLRTLYGIAPSKDALVLAVLDRRLHRIGREAIAALETDESPLTRLRDYLRATNRAVQPTTAAFARDFATVPGASEINEAHTDYIAAVTRGLLEEAIEAGEIRDVNAAAVAHILGRLGYDFAGVEHTDVVRASPSDEADRLADVIFAGLVAEHA